MFPYRIFGFIVSFDLPDEVDGHKDAELNFRNFLTLYDNQWTDEQFDQFYQKLQYTVLGWIRKEGIRKRLKKTLEKLH